MLKILIVINSLPLVIAALQYNRHEQQRRKFAVHDTPLVEAQTAAKNAALVTDTNISGGDIYYFGCI